MSSVEDLFSNYSDYIYIFRDDMNLPNISWSNGLIYSPFESAQFNCVPEIFTVNKFIPDQQYD